MPQVRIDTTDAYVYYWDDNNLPDHWRVQAPSSPEILLQATKKDTSIVEDTYDSKYLVCRALQISALNKKAITSIRLYAYGKATHSVGAVYSPWVYVSALTQDYDGQTPNVLKNGQYLSSLHFTSSFSWQSIPLAFHMYDTGDKASFQALKKGFGFEGNMDSWGNTLGTQTQTIQVYPPQSSNYKPYFMVTYEDAPLYTSNVYPQSGWVNRYGDVTFSWDVAHDYPSVEDAQQAQAVFYWKDGEDGQENAIQLTTQRQTTISANTLPQSADIRWRVVITSDDSVTNQNAQWYTITTIDETSSAKAMEPSQVYVDGSASIRFAWEHIIGTASAQTAYDLQYKTASGEWTTFSAQHGNQTYFEAPAGTLPSGTIKWRVRTYNTDGVAGTWSDEQTIVVIAAPTAPSVAVVSSSPRPEISWQSIDQKAYQVRMGEYESGLLFGTKKAFKCPVYLPDGPQAMQVRIMNEFNMWSDWAQRMVTVTNQAHGALVLTVEGTQDAVLTWYGGSDAGQYWIYRDGKRIAKTEKTTYVDTLAIGQHTYFVRATQADSDHYTDSQEVSKTLTTTCPIICALGEEWLSLGLASESTQAVQVSSVQNVSLTQMSGSIYPKAEVSAYRQRSYDILAAFQDQASCARFEGLLGKIVCVKDQFDNLCVGILNAFNKAQTRFFTEYSATVREIDEGEYLEDD